MADKAKKSRLLPGLKFFLIWSSQQADATIALLFLPAAVPGLADGFLYRPLTALLHCGFSLVI
ncbi:MAG: hypothetical protein CVV11_08610 [Gammaproteobacteria bacterium HGW-Gammaproteobacteria-15]|nr:MAG: hypothetical protein CVV11_08610 [Gammaproteobacteria bacterium HGW-Gammaproteobacteria-15]